ncbi:MAG: LysM peptidoglycan-binding domain-containing protein [Chloroflexi bacterium]|nr:LysM peptidoglycan-binding domain-containing protein [Chloroflexota bacterium]
MKSSSLRFRWLIIAAVLTLALTACVRPIQRDETPVPLDAAPTTDVLIIPTEPAPEDAADTGTSPDGGETGDASTDASTTEGTADSTDAGEAAGDAATDASGDVSSETSEETTTEQPGEGTDGEVTHVVKSGETLGHIAQMYDVSIADIAAANNIADIDSLDMGQTLIIKAGASAGDDATTTEEGGEQVHVVQAGENLFRIGLRYGFTPEELAAHNGIADITRIDVGQIIKIPPK